MALSDRDLPDRDLYDRGVATLLASWEEYARGSDGAAVHRLAGVSAAVFPAEPERPIYNNAVLARDRSAAERVAAVEAMEAAYAEAGIRRYAAWVHDSDDAMRSELVGRGYRLDDATRAMGMPLDDLALPRPELDLGEWDWSEYLRLVGVPGGLHAGVDQQAFHILVARLGAVNVATATAYDHDGDCGVFNVGTVEGARRRGLGTALTALLLHDAVARGCTTATLQSTPMAERVYAAVGFRDLGRFLEYVP